ncbi:MAG: hypothetical protein Alpg2KO_30000 [Alphaproteobacteria bacterium]
MTKTIEKYPIEPVSGLPLIGKIGFDPDFDAEPESWMLEPKPPEPYLHLKVHSSSTVGGSGGKGAMQYTDGTYGIVPVGRPHRDDGTMTRFEGLIPGPTLTYANSKPIERALYGQVNIADAALRADLEKASPGTFEFIEIEFVTKDGSERMTCWWIVVKHYILMSSVHVYSPGIMFNYNTGPIGPKVEWQSTPWGGEYLRYSDISHLDAFAIQGMISPSSFYINPRLFDIFKKHNRIRSYNKVGFWGSGNRGWHPMIHNDWPASSIPYPSEIVELKKNRSLAILGRGHVLSDGKTGNEAYKTAVREITND